MLLKNFIPSIDNGGATNNKSDRILYSWCTQPKVHQKLEAQTFYTLELSAESIVCSQKPKTLEGHNQIH